MARFQLDPSKSAMENLYEAARIATVVVMRRYNYYGLRGKLRDELFDEIMHHTVEHFILVKVRRHTYAHTTKDGKRKLVFMDNVLSSSWSASVWTVNRFMAHLTVMSRTADIEPIKFFLGNNDRLPNYLTHDDCPSRSHKNQKLYSHLKRPQDRAKRLREDYLDYTLEAQEMHLCEILPFHKWLGRNGYTAENDPELFWSLLPDREKREILGDARFADEEKSTKLEIHRRKYQREYARKRRRAKQDEMNRRLTALYGEPIPGRRWVERSDGKIIQMRI